MFIRISTKQGVYHISAVQTTFVRQDKKYLWIHFNGKEDANVFTFNNEEEASKALNDILRSGHE